MIDSLQKPLTESYKEVDYILHSQVLHYNMNHQYSSNERSVIATLISTTINPTPF